MFPQTPVSGKITDIYAVHQRYIYRVDPDRVNEYGQVLTEAEVRQVDASGESKKNK